jgi:glycosyltransferase involved in cell wall biosynthesis
MDSKLKFDDASPGANLESELHAPDHPSWQARTAAAVQGLRIVATQGYRSVPLWVRSVHAVTARPVPRDAGRVRRWFAARGIPDPGLIVRLLREASRADAVLLYGGERSDLIYLCIAAWLPWIRAPHLIMDAHWQPASTPLKRALQRLCLRLGLRLVAEVQVQVEGEVPIYARNFGLPKQLLSPLPWSSSLHGFDAHPQIPAPLRRGIVTGGMSYRDNGTLIEAARRTGVPLTIAIPPSPEQDEARRHAQGLPDVQVLDAWDDARFWPLVAHARAFALPMVGGLQRANGVQTYLTAMALGQVVAVTRSVVSEYYIEDGVNGFLVPAGDVQAWCDVLNRIESLSLDERARIEAAALHTGRRTFSETRRIVSTLERAAAAARQWRR